MIEPIINKGIIIMKGVYILVVDQWKARLYKRADDHSSPEEIEGFIDEPLKWQKSTNVSPYGTSFAHLIADSLNHHFQSVPKMQLILICSPRVTDTLGHYFQDILKDNIQSVITRDTHSCSNHDIERLLAQPDHNDNTF